ncbi:ribosome biogenesis GTPase [Spiroplasma turonicum]|uniref:Small ribosomal subunit biogenesis GTPase RsgA n=1 Tax=Spiroplasma turonicum TaxID=216946 RepID=A0A0K1P569_9MOLU|nr:ribosome biogenesis GTPase [Spiroplasma turonicum]
MYVLYKEKIYICNSKGNLRHNKKTPITGDLVEFEILNEEEKTGLILSIKERKNELYRPKIANINQVIIVTSLKEPNLNTLTLNKYLFFIETIKLEPVLLFTKTDLLTKTDENYKKALEYYKLGYKSIFISNINKVDIDFHTLEEVVKDKVSVFTGQTGAGKSTTLNNLIPNLFEKTQEISKSLNRGKHTTTKNELFIYKGGLIADSPGFSSFQIKEINPIDLAKKIKVFEKFVDKCKFYDCIHINTPNCEVINQYKNNKIPEFIYNDYVKIQMEIKNTLKRG